MLPVKWAHCQTFAVLANNHGQHAKYYKYLYVFPLVDINSFPYLMEFKKIKTRFQLY